jgi:hypothetical protein
VRSWACAHTGSTRICEIRLSGAWRERVRFLKGADYVVSVEKAFRTIILQGSFEKVRRR